MGIQSVFVSYSHKDRAIVQPTIEIQQDLNYAAFIDFRDTTPGTSWKEAHHAAIMRSQRVLLCWSKNAAASAHVRREWSFALENRVGIIPVLLDDTPLPEELTHIHALSSLITHVNELRNYRRWKWFARYGQAVGAMLLCLATLAVMSLAGNLLNDGAGALLQLSNVLLMTITIFLLSLLMYVAQAKRKWFVMKETITRLVIEELKVWYRPEASYLASQGIREANPPCAVFCPHCRGALRTEMARQCFTCGMDWHDPEHPVRRGEGTLTVTSRGFGAGA